MSDFGELRDYIVGGSFKRLSAVECDSAKSNQHELNATREMKNYLGEEAKYQAVFLRLDDDEDNIISDTGEVTWYDARKSHPTRSEYRFYYQDNPAIEKAKAGDVIAVILKKDNTVLLVSAPADSQSELELFELFGGDISFTFNVLDFSENEEVISVTKRFILEELGIEVKAEFGTNYLDIISSRFGGLVFPKTKLFSNLARELAGELRSFATADEAVVKWWDTEEAMFRQLEGALIDNKLLIGFNDAEDFLTFSQTIRQRRNSRAGSALENHLESLFTEKGIHYTPDPKTENNKKPDFIFPSIEGYHDDTFDKKRLTMLGVKTTCKDRWRQVLSEADRIPDKHLFTLQPKISSNQTSEMIASNLQLVIPQSIHSTYTNDQQDWLWNFENFIERVTELQ